MKGEVADTPTGVVMDWVFGEFAWSKYQKSLKKKFITKEEHSWQIPKRFAFA